MKSEFTEEEMRQALFGTSQPSTPVVPSPAQKPEPDNVNEPQTNAAISKRTSKAFTPRLVVILQVGNEFEGQTFEMTYEANTLSTLLAEQEATKAAKRKYRYVQVVSVKSM